MIIWKKKSKVLIINRCVTKTHRRLRKAFAYIKNNLIDSDGNMYWIVDPLRKINNIITGSNNTIFRKFNAKPCGLDKTYMDKDGTEDYLYLLKTPTKFYSILLYKIPSFCNGNGRLCKILFANHDKVILLMRQKVKNPNNNIK